MMRSRFTSVPPLYWMASSPGCAVPPRASPGPGAAALCASDGEAAIAAAIIVPDKRKSRRWTFIQASQVFVRAECSGKLGLCSARLGEPAVEANNQFLLVEAERLQAPGAGEHGEPDYGGGEQDDIGLIVA